MCFGNKCLNGYKKEEIDSLFCESEESMKVCEKCDQLFYDPSTGLTVCRLSKGGKNI